MKKMNLLSIIALGAAAVGLASAQQTVPPDSSKMSDILARMKNGDLHAQKLAFDDLMARINSETPRPTGSAKIETRPAALRSFFAQHPDQADPVKVGLIQLLLEEDGYFVINKNPPPDPHEEDDIGEHYAELIEVVASLEDQRAIPALVGAMTTGGMAQRGLFKYGDTALEPVMDQLKSPDALVRATALGMSIALLQKHDDPPSKTRIRDLIRSSLTDPEPVVRSQAVRETTCLDNRQDFVPMLQQIAKTDPWKLPGKADDGGDGEEFYPVRFDARRVLRDIQNNKTCSASPK
jgi:hypothetical protein